MLKAWKFIPVCGVPSAFLYAAPIYSLADLTGDLRVLMVLRRIRSENIPTWDTFT